MRSEVAQDTKAFLSNPDLSTACPNWAGVHKDYLSLLRLREEVDLVLERLSPFVEDLLSDLRSQERRLLELKVAQANKTSPQNITEEMRLSYAEALSDQDTAMRRVARTNAKAKGRPLLQKLHPDKGGDPVLFNIVRKSVESGDVDLLQIFLYRMGQPTDSALEVRSRIRSRILLLSGSRVYQIVRSYVSRPLEDTVNELRALLDSKVLELKQQSTPGGFGPPPTEGIEDVEQSLA
jgi:hypothetical protein